MTALSPLTFALSDAPEDDQWQVPDPVEAPNASKIRSTLVLFSEKVGIRWAGWATLFTTIACALMGWMLRWSEMRMIAVFAGTALLIALLCTIGRPSFNIELIIPSRRVTVGDDASGKLQITNPKRRRVFSARLDLPVGDALASIRVPSLKRGGSRVESFTIPTDRRCVMQIGPAQAIQGDPFSMTGRQTKWTTAIEVFVHPQIVPLAGRQTGFLHDLEGHSSNHISSSDISFLTLREYAPGDDRRQVHWRSSAHIGKLMVRQFEETLQSRVALGIDISATGYLGEDDFELAVSAAASLAVQIIRDQNPIAMFSNTEVLPAVSGPVALDQMSRLARKSGDLQTLANTMLRLEPKASVVIIVTGAGTTLDQLRLTCASFNLDTRVVGVLVDPEAKMTVRNVANVSLVRISSLNQLPSAMRRSMPV